ncbi:glycosyl hydrolase family 61-domain-containing protein [Fimicolochytrium jonesii]|uniref:glycosyl hydrolase family 61-domain-containing protein n=1 Tax=Fimicolochytrium jonesii TaxID=1396493 RepID=UPI0022FEB688|nr:glycosyl hydrolase family 61-domain-containing protein [Fimicolochytrium jonesii]KAI8820077.1 glycosyl hydrolase family 61-domain-containing protein [Fimicolochytrium jonesii]
MRTSSETRSKPSLLLTFAFVYKECSEPMPPLSPAHHPPFTPRNHTATMHLTLATLATLSTLVIGAHAHGLVTEATINGITYPAWDPYRDPYTQPNPQRIFRKTPGNGPVDMLSADIQCNGNAGSGSDPAPLVAPATAGSSISLKWTAWPSSHKGPVLTYMARCPATGCAGYKPGDAAVWFKVHEEGKSASGTWASEPLESGATPYTFTIPKQLQDGEYIVRHEIAALHSAFSFPGIQFYPNCFQIKLSGGGSATGPSEKVAFPGAYTPTTPGVVFDIYQNKGAYPIPGPAVWPAGAAGDAPVPPPVPAPTTVVASTRSKGTTVPVSTPTVVPTPTESTELPYCDETTVAAPTPTTDLPYCDETTTVPTETDLPYCDETTTPVGPTTTPVAPPPATSTATPPPGPCAPLYYQCGGTNWKGPTCCQPGSRCKVQNPFYHQCVSIQYGK